MVEYYVVPKYGCSVDDISLEGANIDNAMIVGMVGGTVVEVHPYTSLNVERYNAKPHPMFFREKGIFELGGRLLGFEPRIFSGFLASGWNPFKQIVWLFVRERGSATQEEIVEFVVIEKKYLKDKAKNRKWISKLVDYLRYQGWLNMVEGRLITGHRRLPIGGDRIAIRDGYNPVLDQMMNFIAERGTATLSELSDYMIRDLGWIERDPVTGADAGKVLRAYVKLLRREGYIKEVEKDRFEVLKPLERNG